MVLVKEIEHLPILGDLLFGKFYRRLQTPAVSQGTSALRLSSRLSHCVSPSALLPSLFCPVCRVCLKSGSICFLLHSTVAFDLTLGFAKEEAGVVPDGVTIPAQSARPQVRLQLNIQASAEAGSETLADVPRDSPTLRQFHFNFAARSAVIKAPTREGQTGH